MQVIYYPLCCFDLKFRFRTFQEYVILFDAVDKVVKFCFVDWVTDDCFISCKVILFCLKQLPRTVYRIISSIISNFPVNIFFGLPALLNILRSFIFTWSHCLLFSGYIVSNFENLPTHLSTSLFVLNQISM